MKKTEIFNLLFLLLILLCSSVSATLNNISSGSFDSSVQVLDAGSNPVTNSSGSFDTKIFLEYFQWTTWSGWWTMEYAGGLEVTSLTATNFNDTAINLSWTPSGNTTHVYIRRKPDTAPTTRTDGVFVCNVSVVNTTFNDTGIGQGTNYYYSAWAYNSTGNVFSDTYDTADNYTNPDCPSDFTVASENMESIGLTWTKGTNATSTIVYMNATGETGSPTKDNGTQKINTGGESGTASDLDVNTTYWFTAYSYDPNSGLWSLCNDTTTGTTLPSADSPTGLTATQWNHTQLNLTWTEGSTSIATVIRRKTIGDPTGPTDGTLVGGGFIYTNSIYDTGLEAATKYYYRAWGWNGINYSVNSTPATGITRPQSPQNFTGDIEGSNLVISWDYGEGADSTIIRNDTGQYPTTVTSGTPVNAGNFTPPTNSTIASGVSSINYYRGWSYAQVDNQHIHSLHQDLLWGGLEVNTYNESNPSISLLNYTVFIKNQDGTQTYINTTATNPCRIDLDDLPLGDDIIIQVSKDGYKTRTQVMDLQENVWYIVNFYLPPDVAGGGEPGEPDYVPPDDSNITYAEQYSIFVVGPKDQYNADPPIENAYVTIEFYNNVTDEYDEIFSDYTDANGQLSVWLIPGTIYQVIITHDSYITERIPNFIPREILYADDWKYTFRMTPIDSTTGKSYDYFWRNITFTATMVDAGYLVVGNMTVTYNDVNSSTIDTDIYLYEVYNGSSTFMNSSSKTGNNSFTVTFSSINTSRSYKVVLFFNNTATFGDVISPVMLGIDPIHFDRHTFSLNQRMTTIFGPFTINSIPVGWDTVFSVIIAVVILMLLGPFNVGVGLISSGIALGFSNFIFTTLLTDTFPPLLLPLAIFLIIVGIIYMWSKHRGAEIL